MFEKSKHETKRNTECGFSIIELVVVCFIMTIILGAMALVVGGLQKSYAQRRVRNEQINDGEAALDLMTRVIRVAGANTTAQALTPTGTAQLRVRSDWNPVDSAFNGQYEDTTFYLSGGSLYARNETTSVAQELTPNVSSLSFQYLDASGAATSTAAQIARVRVSLVVGSNSYRAFTSNILIREGVQIK